MGKIAFCFPGQGALEAGMGREIAEAVPAAMEVYRVGSEASGLDLKKLCFDSPLEDLVETEVSGARGGKFQRQRQSVEALTDRHDLVIGCFLDD